jgi:hypothetical protein
MHSNSRVRARGWSSIAVAGALVLAACSSDDGGDGDSAASTEAAEQAAGNACPPDGCSVVIESVDSAGDELAVVFDANFDPDFANNHLHVYWDTYTAEQVSSDASDRGVEQGAWHPTDEYPEYTTQQDASVSVANGSTTLCVTPADRDHAVIDPTQVACVDVSDLIG